MSATAETLRDAAARAAEALARARALVVTAGAGMGVDSGLPDFRGTEGFWNAYPPYRALGLAFAELANPRWFRRDPALAWGFYGHRLQLYRDTTPHEGFAILQRLAAPLAHGAFVFTSNVDGQFQRAGFADERVVECHGSLHHLQCLRDCGAGLFSADGVRVDVDAATFRAAPPYPACPSCGGLARPAVLMFGDGEWDGARTDAQEGRLRRWLRDVARGSDDGEVVVFECGAGTAIPTVRLFGERLVRELGATLVRINVREPEVPEGQLGIAAGALAGLRAIEEALARR